MLALPSVPRYTHERQNSPNISSYFLMLMSDRFTELLLALNLQDSPSSPKKNTFFLKRRRRGPYAFTVKEASEALKTSADEAARICSEFMNCRLLHDPDDRMRQNVKPRQISFLQPTAKGFATSREYCSVRGLNPPGDERYWTMKLLAIERSPGAKLLILSPAVAMVVWYKMLGAHPVVYGKEDKNSAFYHGAWSHPSTSALSQYWSSDGVRFFESLRFFRDNKKTYVKDLCLTGKALWQWILECTTVESPEEATKLAKLILRQRFLEPINDPVAEAVTCSDSMPKGLSRSQFYQLTTRGIRLCRWDDLVKEVSPTPLDGSWKWEYAPRSSEYSLDDLFAHYTTLDLVLSEPGVKMMFRQKLTDWLCVENLYFIDDYRHLLVLLDTNPLSSKVNQAILIHLNYMVDCYFRLDAPRELNLSSSLKERACQQISRNVDEAVKGLVPVMRSTYGEACTLISSYLLRFAECSECRDVPLRNYVVGIRSQHATNTQRYDPLQAIKT